MLGYDLHTHTIFSDGTTTPEENVAMALALDLEGLAVTDHDTTAGYERTAAAAEGSRLEVILGTEFSAELDGSSVHVLGYWVDPDDPALVAEMDRLRNERSRRAEEIVGKFATLGVPVRLERVVELAAGAPIGRPHIARAVVETGTVATTQEVFDHWLADGGPAYVPKYAVDPVTAVRLIIGAGGVAVLAHPGLFGARDGAEGVAAEVVEEMAAAGLSGIEADHPDHTDEHRARYRDLAAALDLVVTAGSDFHGTREEGGALGRSTTPRAALERLRASRR